MSDDMLDQRSRHRLEDLQDIVKEDAKLIQNLRREIEKLRDAYDEKTKELCDELTRLRADLAAVTEERDRLREVVKRADSYIHNGIELGFIRHCDTPEDPAYHTPRIVREAACAAIECVTEPVALWQHRKTGGIYEIIGECQIEATNTPGVLYRNTSTGVTWVRPKEEFFDGRFVEWRKQASQTGGGNGNQ